MAQLIVTDCSAAYVPASGLKVGVETASGRLGVETTVCGAGVVEGAGAATGAAGEAAPDVTPVVSVGDWQLARHRARNRKHVLWSTVYTVAQKEIAAKGDHRATDMRDDGPWFVRPRSSRR